MKCIPPFSILRLTVGAASILLLLMVGALLRAEPTGDPGGKAKDNGGLLVSMLGGTIRRGLGLSAGDFAEFSLNRIRIVNARMAAPAFGKEGNTDTTFLKVDEILIEYSALELMNKRILKRVVIERPQLWISELTRKIEDPANQPKPPPVIEPSKPPQGASIKLTVERLELKNVEVYIDTLRNQGLNIPLRFAQKEPLVLEHLSMNELLNHPGDDKLITVDADQVMVHSAYGPMAPLFSVGKLEMSFTWKGLYNKQLESLILTDPALDIGEDWFLMLKEFKKTATVADASPEEARKKIKEENFMVKKFEIQRLKISLSSFGVIKMELPFAFHYEAENVGLDQNGRFFLNSQLSIDEPNFQMPEYQLSVQGLTGDVKFNWPPDRTANNNIVPTLRATSLKFKDYVLTQPWAALTFMTQPGVEANGLNKKPTSRAYLGFGAECYGGYLNGHIETDFSQAWAATVTGSNINVSAINAFHNQGATGVFQMKMEAHGEGTNIKFCQIKFTNGEGVPLILDMAGSSDLFFGKSGNGSATPTVEEEEKKRMAELSIAQRTRSGEIQALKNARFIGENKEGYIEARVSAIDAKFPGASKLIIDENDGRKQIYQFIAERDHLTLEQVQLEYGTLWQERSFPGEWIESPALGWVEK